MNFFASSWHVEQGSCAAGSAAAAAGAAGIGVGAGVGAGGCGGEAGGCCAFPEASPTTRQRATAPRVKGLIDMASSLRTSRGRARGPCGPPLQILNLPGVDSVDGPIFTAAVARGTRFGGGRAAGERGGVQERVRGGVAVVVAAEAGRGGRTLRREVVARGVHRGDAGLQRRDVG